MSDANGQPHTHPDHPPLPPAGPGRRWRFFWNDFLVGAMWLVVSLVAVIRGDAGAAIAAGFCAAIVAAWMPLRTVNAYQLGYVTGMGDMAAGLAHNNPDFVRDDPHPADGLSHAGRPLYVTRRPPST